VGKRSNDAVGDIDACCVKKRDKVMMLKLGVVVLFTLMTGTAMAQTGDLSSLSDLAMGRVRAQNALWIENPVEKQFLTTTRVVVADIKGPAQIEMMHFAMPGVLELGREAILEIYWDGETRPSVNCPLVDFFCDPAGQFESVQTVVLNKRRGFNVYFPMPFRKSARVELVYDGDLPPGAELQSKMPCYSYVMYRQQEGMPEGHGYFHANWRQQVVPLGKEAYIALEAEGSGKFVGWSVTVRRPGRPGYPVDMNELFYVDGEEESSIEFQGIEDSFGFSWGFPPTNSEFLVSGYRKFMQGAAAYRFFLGDAITFSKSLQVAINFGENEHPVIVQSVGDEGFLLEMSSVCYWYQAEPRTAQPPLPPLAERMPAPDDNPGWPEEEALPSEAELRERGVAFYMLCGRPTEEVFFAEEGFALAHAGGFAWAGFPGAIYHCRADNKMLNIDLSVPEGAQGTLRLFIVDPDRFGGGRKERISVDGKEAGVFEKFESGKWVEAPIDADMTADGTVGIAFENLNPDGNAVVSIIEWVAGS